MSETPIPWRLLTERYAAQARRRRRERHNRCRRCGRFRPWDALVCNFTPDTEFTSERIEHECAGGCT